VTSAIASAGRPFRRDDVGDARGSTQLGPDAVGLLDPHVEADEPQLVDDVLARPPVGVRPRRAGADGASQDVDVRLRVDHEKRVGGGPQAARPTKSASRHAVPPAGGEGTGGSPRSPERAAGATRSTPQSRHGTTGATRRTPWSRHGASAPCSSGARKRRIAWRETTAMRPGKTTPICGAGRRR